MSRILPTIRLRLATPIDAPVIADLMHRSFQEYEGVLDPPSGVHKETADSVLCKMATGAWVMALQEEEAVGCVWYEPRGDYVYLGRLSVPPEFRGHGIANRLLNAVKEQVSALKIPCIRLAVRIALPRMRAAYERRGYQVIAYERHPGFSEPTFVTLEKRLVTPHLLSE